MSHQTIILPKPRVLHRRSVTKPIIGLLTNMSTNHKKGEPEFISWKTAVARTCRYRILVAICPITTSFVRIARYRKYRGPHFFPKNSASALYIKNLKIHTSDGYKLTGFKRSLSSNISLWLSTNPPNVQLKIMFSCSTFRSKLWRVQINVQSPSISTLQRSIKMQFSSLGRLYSIDDFWNSLRRHFAYKRSTNPPDTTTTNKHVA